MAAPNILEQYVVSLSMKGPSAAEQRDAEKAFSTLAEAVSVVVPTITAAATAIVYATDKIAAGLGRLYFESQKTGATVREITALGYAFEQNGSTLEKFHADFNKFAQTLRDFPEYKKLLRDRLQLRPEDFKDDATLYSATLLALAKKRAAGDTQSEGAFRNLFGFDEDNIIARGRKEFDKFYAEGFERNKGIDEISVKALALVRSLNAFGAALEAVARKAAAALFDKYGIVFNDMTKWIDDHSKEIISVVSEIVDQFVLAWKDIEPIAVPAVRKIGAGLDSVAAALDRLLGSPDGQHGGLHAVRYVLDALAVYIAGKWALKLLGMLGLRGIGGAALGALGIGGAAAVAGAGAAAYGVLSNVPPAEGGDSYGLDHPGWHLGMPKEKTRHQKEGEAAAPAPASRAGIPEPRVQGYIGKGGYGPFSRDQTIGAGQDFNIPGSGRSRPISGSATDINVFPFVHHMLAAVHRNPQMFAMFTEKSSASRNEQWSRTNNIGTRKQITNIQLASIDPHTAASEIARHMKSLHAGTLRSLDRLA